MMDAITNFKSFLLRCLRIAATRGLTGIVCLCLSALFVIADDSLRPNDPNIPESDAVEAVSASSAKVDQRICPLTNRETPWGSFISGTWVVRRTNSQRFLPNSAATTTVTDTWLTLEEVNDCGFSLRQETAIGLGNGAVTPAPICLTFDFYQQAVSEGVTIEQLQPQTLVVARRQVVCQVCRYTLVSTDQKKTTTLWYSNTVMPHVLRTEEIRTHIPKTADEAETVLSHAIMTVTDTSDVRLFKNILNEYKTQTIKKTATGTTISQATFSANIPGGLLREVTVETDPTGKVTARNVTSVIDYFVASSGTATRRYRSQKDASREIQSNWENVTHLDD